MAEQYSSRPSQLLGISDPYTAWCLDDAVYAWGMHVEAELEKASSEGSDEKQRKNKVKLAWRRLFPSEGEHEEASTSQFRDPMSKLRK